MTASVEDTLELARLLRSSSDYQKRLLAHGVLSIEADLRLADVQTNRQEERAITAEKVRDEAVAQVVRRDEVLEQLEKRLQESDWIVCAEALSIIRERLNNG